MARRLVFVVSDDKLREGSYSMKSIILVCCLALIGAGGCKKKDAAAEAAAAGIEVPPPPTSQLKIKIGLNGDIHANNKVLTQEEFMQELQRLKQSNGGILYTRDNPTKDPNPAQAAVID